MKREFRKLFVYAAVVIGLTFFVITFVAQRTQVNGESMYPALHDKDNLIVDKFSYHFCDPKRYDIVVFPYHYKDRTYYIKRVIGLPGETVQIKDGCVYIDGQRLDEHFSEEKIQNAALASEPFVLGDNRNASEDSRFPDVGKVKRKEIIGRAWIRIWPLNGRNFKI